MQMVDCGQCVFINDNFGQVSADAMSIDYVTLRCVPLLNELYILSLN